MVFMQYVFPENSVKRYRFPTHINDLVMCRSQAQASEVFFVVLAPGEAPPMHQHDDTEQIFLILQGQGRLEIGQPSQSFTVQPGDTVRIPVSTPHRIQNEGQSPLRYFAVDCFPNGRPTDEPTWDIHARANCQKYRWDYQQVITTPQ